MPAPLNGRNGVMVSCYPQVNARQMHLRKCGARHVVLSKSVVSDTMKSIDLAAGNTTASDPTSRWRRKESSSDVRLPKRTPSNLRDYLCTYHASLPRCGAVIDVVCARSAVIKRLAELTDAAYGLGLSGKPIGSSARTYRQEHTLNKCGHEDRPRDAVPARNLNQL